MLRTTIPLVVAAGALAATSACSATEGRVAAPVAPPTSGASPTGADVDLSSKRFSTPVLRTNPFDSPDADHRITYGANFTSNPAPASLRDQEVSAEEARRLALRDQNFGAAAQPGDPRVVLRMVTVGDVSKPATLVARPAWVLTWSNSYAMIHGPVEMTEAERDRYRASHVCEFVVAVDARTGASVEVDQFCEPR